MEPKFEHDCDACLFLGRLEIPGLLPCDVYFCDRCDRGSVVLRYGSPGSEYSSMAVSVIRKDGSWKAWKTGRGFEAGLFLLGFSLGTDAWNGGVRFEQITGEVAKTVEERRWTEVRSEIIDGANACVLWLEGWKDDARRIGSKNYQVSDLVLEFLATRLR